MQKYDVIVVGAGAAGMIAAGRAAELGARVVVLERNSSPGRKLSLTGSGRCNITNSASQSEFINHVHPNGRFLKNAFSRFFREEILELLQLQKVDVSLERGGRYFPTSNRAQDIVKALHNYASEKGVELKTGQRVAKILQEEGAVTGVIANDETYRSGRVILATGGKSYPATGSTGDGYHLAGEIGHTLNDPFPALVPLLAEESFVRRLSGLSLRNVRATVWSGQRKSAEAFGEMTFTESSLSGPIILTLSRGVVISLKAGEKVTVCLDLKPALDEQKLDRRLLRDLDAEGKKQLKTLFKNWLPNQLIPVFMEVLKLDPEKPGHQVSAGERKQIRNLMKKFTFSISGHGSFKEAIITAGGIPTAEINPKTMESKILNGLYFAGEIIDLDGETGGYNLQIAWSTGWVAGDSAGTIPG